MAKEGNQKTTLVPGFFENLRDYSEIKLRILGQFLAPWAAKLGFWARSKNGVIWYVDGFAGPGEYGDGSDGSPLLGLRRAKHIRMENRGYSLACFFVEKVRKHWRSLEHLAAPFRQDGIAVHNERGEFSKLIPAITQATQGSPIMLFVDPFGISPLKYEPFLALLKRPWPLDIILTFQHRAVHRLATDYPHLITDAIGTDAWEKEWRQRTDPRSQTEAVLEIFKQRILDDGDFLKVFYYPIRPSLRSAPKYYLLFASRHYDAFELWNDEVTREEATLSLKEYQKLAVQGSFLPSFDEEARALNLLNDVREVGRFLGKFTRRDVIMYFVEYRWGQYHTKDIKKAVGSLIASGEITRDSSQGKDINTDFLYFNP